MDSSQQTNLYLVGFMGTGKSTIGRLAAKKLGLRFEDSDHAIEETQGRSIPEIFEDAGEEAFRKMERAYIQSGHGAHGMLVACGGGLVIESGMMDFVKTRGLVFSLIASAKAIYERVKRNSGRPLLQVEDPLAQIERILAVRDPVYREAHVQILTEGRTINEVVGHVCRGYRTASARLGK